MNLLCQKLFGSQPASKQSGKWEYTTSYETHHTQTYDCLLLVFFSSHTELQQETLKEVWLACEFITYLFFVY